MTLVRPVPSVEQVEEIFYGPECRLCAQREPCGCGDGPCACECGRCNAPGGYVVIDGRLYKVGGK